MYPVKIRNIIFDLGNTLLFFDTEYFYEGVSKLEKKLKPVHLKKYILKRGIYLKLITSKISHLQFFKILKRKFNLKIGFRDFISLYNDIFWENRPMLNFMESLVISRKYRLFVLSNTDSMHMLYINRNFPQINLIKRKILSYRVKLTKPSKSIFKFAISKYNIEPSETIYIDDMKENIQTAKNLGFHAIRFINYKNFTKAINRFIKKKLD